MLLVQEIPDDRERLSRAAATLRRGPFLFGADGVLGAIDDRVETALDGGPSSALTSGQFLSIFAEAVGLLDTLESLIVQLGGVPGRKAIVLVSLVFLGFMSFLALKEYLSLIPTRRADRSVLLWAYLAVPLQYLWVWVDWYGMFIIFIPVYMFMLIPVRMVLHGQTEGFLRAAGTLHWGLMITVFTLSHIAYLLQLPEKGGAAGASLVLFLVLVTQFNDVAQYTWGKLFGRHKVMPTVSPNKTYEGLLGGIATSFVLVVLLAPWLTPLTRNESYVAGFFLPLAGFLGDVSVSAIKRDIGVKDASSMIPGHGGVLDRVNSLTFTAPLFFHFLRYLHF